MAKAIKNVMARGGRIITTGKGKKTEVGNPEVQIARNSEVIKGVASEGKITITTGDGETIEIVNPRVLVVSDGRRSFSPEERERLATLPPLPKPLPKKIKGEDISGPGT